MNNLYNNVIDKNDFYNKLTVPSALLVSLIYILSVTLIPIISDIINTKNNAYVSAAKQYNALANKVLVTKTNNAIFNTINTTTYINNGQMLARQIDNNNLQNYVNDAKGSVLKLNSVDKSQNQIYSYDAYGKPIVNITKSNLALNVLNPFQYNGERFDNNTALQYLRARFYNPETKRFLNQDSYELLNRFGYVDGNPVIETDPSGHVKGFIEGFGGFKPIRNENFGTEMKYRSTASIFQEQIATLSLSKGDFTGRNLSNFNFVHNGDLTRDSFIGANFTGANLSRANFTGANLSGANFTGAYLSEANLTGANLSRANLSWAYLSRADFTGANLSRTNLSLANLLMANYAGTIFTETNLSGADFTGANLSRANFSRANLSRADLSGANFSRTNLSGADFSRANLSGANLGEATFDERTNLEETNLEGVHLEGANILEGIVDHSTNIGQMPFQSQVHYDLLARVEVKRSQLTLELLVAKFIVRNAILYN